jgi:hypothetical protein
MMHHEETALRQRCGNSETDYCSRYCQADYLNALVILVSFLVAFTAIAVQVGIELVRSFNSQIASMLAGLCAMIVVTLLAIRDQYSSYVADMKDRARYLDDIPNAQAIGAKWVIYETEQKYKYMLADGRIFEEFDEQGTPKFESQVSEPTA